MYIWSTKQILMVALYMKKRLDLGGHENGDDCSSHPFYFVSNQGLKPSILVFLGSISQHFLSFFSSLLDAHVRYTEWYSTFQIYRHLWSCQSQCWQSFSVTRQYSLKHFQALPISHVHPQIQVFKQSLDSVFWRIKPLALKNSVAQIKWTILAIHHKSHSLTILLL